MQINNNSPSFTSRILPVQNKLKPFMRENKYIATILDDIEEGFLKLADNQNTDTVGLKFLQKRGNKGHFISLKFIVKKAVGAFQQKKQKQNIDLMFVENKEGKVTNFWQEFKSLLEEVQKAKVSMGTGEIPSIQKGKGIGEFAKQRLIQAYRNLNNKEHGLIKVNSKEMIPYLYSKITGSKAYTAAIYKKADDCLPSTAVKISKDLPTELRVHREIAPLYENILAGLKQIENIDSQAPLVVKFMEQKIANGNKRVELHFDMYNSKKDNLEALFNLPNNESLTRKRVLFEITDDYKIMKQDKDFFAQDGKKAKEGVVNMFKKMRESFLLSNKSSETK